VYWYKFNIADWSLATVHLSLIEEAVYFRLINHYYDTEQPFPLETQSVIRRLRLDDYAAVVSAILAEFFLKTQNGFVHERCERELKEYRKQAKKNRENGTKGGRPNKNKRLGKTQSVPSGMPVATESQPSGNPNITLTTNQEPLTNNQEPLTTNHIVLSPEAQDDVRLARFMFNLVQQVSPDSRAPNFEKWADVIRLMRERDGLTHRRIAEVFKWANTDDFWKVNILSPDKLRKQFPQLSAKMEASNAPRRNIAQRPSKLESALDEAFGPAKPTNRMRYRHRVAELQFIDCIFQRAFSIAANKCR